MYRVIFRMPYARRWTVTTAGLAAVCCLAGMNLARAAGDTPAPAEPKAGGGMYLSVRDVFLGSNVFPTPIEGMRHLGVEAVEMNLNRDFSVRALDTGEPVFLRTDDDVKAFRQRTEALGVKICALLTACDFSAGEPESNIAWVARAIEIADLLGASAVRIDSAMSKERELDFEARVKLFVDNLRAVLNRTAASKVTLGIENHGFQGNNLAFLLNVFQQAGSDRLGCTLDAGNFYWRGYPLSEVYGILRILAPYAKHVHVKNIHYPTEQREVMRDAGWEYATCCCPLDEGDIDLAKVAGILGASGYKGDVCIEDESLGRCKTSAERVTVSERNVAHVRRILEGIR